MQDFLSTLWTGLVQNITHIFEAINLYWDKFILLLSKGDTATLLSSIAAIIAILGLAYTIYKWLQSKTQNSAQKYLSRKTEFLPERTAKTIPSKLLQAKYQVIKYRDIHKYLHHSLQWARKRDKETPSRGRLHTGAGGLGKTRLLIEVAEQLRKEKWDAGFLETETWNNLEARQQLEDLIIKGKRKILITLDYAENRKEEIQWLAKCASRRKGQKPLRLVLLARGAGEWWNSLYGESDEVKDLFSPEFGTKDIIEIKEEIPSDKRLELFNQALSDYCEKLGKEQKVAPQSLLTRIETHENYERPLAIAMEALLLAFGEQASEKTNTENNLSELLQNILQLEIKHWGETIGDELDRTMLTRAIQQITLLAGTNSTKGATNLLIEDKYYNRNTPSDVEQPLRWLKQIYGQGDTITPLEPDLIGEHLVLNGTDETLIAANLNWLQTQPDKSKQQTLITVLQRATRKDHGPKSDVASSLLAFIIKNRLSDDNGKTLAYDILETAINTAEIEGQLVSTLEANITKDLDPQSLQNIKAALPTLPEHTLTLREVWDIVSRLIAATLDKPLEEMDETEKKTHADNLICIGLSQSALGRHEAALEATEEAVKICRTLAEAHPDVYLLVLSTSLHNLGMMQSALGRYEAALEATEEAVKIRRTLADARPDAYLPDLAGSLNSLGNRYNALGRHKAALEAAEEAVKIYRTLADARPDAYLPTLAMSLHNLGATEEAVKIYRTLADARPDAYLPDLAASLHNLGSDYNALGRHEAALEAAEEAVKIRRTLADARPDAYLPDLAGSLNNLGNRYNALGRHKAALEATEEAVKLLLPFLYKYPQAHAVNAERHLNNYINRCKTLNREPDETLVRDTRIGIEKAKSETEDTPIRDAG